MKTKMTLMTLLILAAGAAAALAADTTSTANATNSFTITGMHCDGCAKGITSELKRTAGVASATVTFSNQLAVVAYDTNRVTSVQLIKVIREAGFQAQPKTP